MMPFPQAVAPRAGSPETPNAIYENVLAAVITGRLAPGQGLNDHDLLAAQGLSQLAVRKALRQLEAAGLVHVPADRRPRVTIIDPSRTALAARAAGNICALVVEAATPNLDVLDRARLGANLAAFGAAVATNQGLDIARTYWGFYDIFLVRANNPLLTAEVAQLKPQLSRWIVAHPNWKPLAELARQRRSILGCVRKWDGPAAAREVRTLWNDLAQAILTSARQQQAAAT